jgi:hypothetical protein
MDGQHLVPPGQEAGRSSSSIREANQTTEKIYVTAQGEARLGSVSWGLPHSQPSLDVCLSHAESATAPATQQQSQRLSDTAQIRLARGLTGRPGPQQLRKWVGRYCNLRAATEAADTICTALALNPALPVLHTTAGDPVTLSTREASPVGGTCELPAALTSDY